MAFKVMYGEASAQDLRSDYQTAVKFGNCRIGKEALYFPAFPTGAKYILLTALDRAWVRKGSLSPKGCCGGQLPVFVLRIQCGSEFSQNLTFDKETDAQRALSCLKERRPDLPGAPEGVQADSCPLK